MQCVVLVGGRGTRLGPLVADCPKPMLPVNGRPFLTQLIDNAARFGFRRFVLLAGYRGDVVAEYFTKLRELYRDRGVSIEIVIEDLPLGTAGALRHAAEHLDERFLMLNGDSYFDFNLLDLTVPTDGGWIARMALRDVKDASRFGVVRRGPGGMVLSMQERPDAPGPGTINGGIYWMRREVLELIPPTECSLERMVLPRLAVEGKLEGRVYNGFFLDIGLPDTYEDAGRLMSAATRRPAVFFDRDGVLNHDDGYTHRKESFRWMDGAREAVKAVNDAGFYAFVVTNQAGVARGYYQESDVHELHRWMNEDLQRAGAHIDAFRYCPCHPEGIVSEYKQASAWRKPEPGMLLDLMESWPVEVSRSFMIGDQDSDRVAAERARVGFRRYEGGDLAALVAHELSIRRV